MLCTKVVAATGGLTSAGGIMLSYTIGETVTATANTDTVMLTQGFQQVYPELPSATLRLATSPPISVYPNPTSGVIHFKNAPRGIMVDVYDALGRRMPGKFDAPANTMDISLYANGLYLVVVAGNGNAAQTFTISKLGM